MWSLFSTFLDKLFWNSPRKIFTHSQHCAVMSFIKIRAGNYILHWGAQIKLIPWFFLNFSLDFDQIRHRRRLPRRVQHLTCLVKIGSVKSHTSHTGFKKLYGNFPQSLSHLGVNPCERSTENTAELCGFHENPHVENHAFPIGVIEFTCTLVVGNLVIL